MSALSEIPVQEFLGKVKALGIHLEANGGHINVGWPEKIPDPEIRRTIISRKPEILEALRAEPRHRNATDHFSETELEYYLNLLEIMQSEKFGLERGVAEREAFEIVDEYRSRRKKRLELPSQQKGNGKEIAQIFFGKKSDGKEKN